MTEENIELKLSIELVPSTSWYNNLRKVLSKSDWDVIRKKEYANYGYRCGICKAEGRLNCHEVWEYDDKKHVQKLVGFIALCNMCHHVKHIGLAQRKADYGEVVKHFMNVNNCDEYAFIEHLKAAFEVWRNRSKYEWHVDLGEYENMVEMFV